MVLLTAIPVQFSMPFQTRDFFYEENPRVDLCANGLAEFYRPEGR